MAAPNYDVVNNNTPAETAAAVTPSDSVSFTRPARGLYIGGAGNAALLLLDDSVVTFSGLSAGTILPVRCKRVNNTNTNATNIVALW